MDLTPYVDKLRDELAVAAEAGCEETLNLAERLTAPLDSATRLVLLSALSAAADEITRDLAPGSVDVRLRGLDPEFVVTPPPFDSAGEQPAGYEPRSQWRSPMTARPRGSTSACPSSSSSRSRRPPRAKASRSTPGWCGPLPRPSNPAIAAGAPHDHTRTGGQRYTGWVR